MVETFQAHRAFKGFRIEGGGLAAEIIELGGIVTRLEAADRSGRRGNVLLGPPAIADYLRPHPHFNCLVGRYANRITDARFTLDGTSYRLDANIPPHHLHGGERGLGTRVWRGETDGDAVVLRLDSAAGDGGYPGHLAVTARYTLDGRRLAVDLQATTDAPTPVSLTSHLYFNLSGRPGRDVLDHEVQVQAGAFLPVSAELTQQGEIRPVDGTPFDLRRPVRLAEALARDDPQLRLAGGFDHNFALDGEGLRSVATVYHPASGRRLEVATDQPGLQLYTGNSLPEAGYVRHGALCLETQQFPDAPNHAAYPDAILRPGKRFRARTAFCFYS